MPSRIKSKKKTEIKGQVFPKDSTFQKMAKRTKNYLIIAYLVIKFIQNLKSCVKVKRIIKIKPFHLNVLGDQSSFYKDGNNILSQQHTGSLQIIPTKTKSITKSDSNKRSFIYVKFIVLSK